MKKNSVLLVVYCLFSVPVVANTKVIALLEGEHFWGGCVTDGRAMPFGSKRFERDLYGNTQGNQAQPLLLSDRGRYVWCEEPFKFTFAGKTLKVEARAGEIRTGKQGDTLREVFQYVSHTYFPSTGQIPDERLFIKPQYNTWIELIYDQREDRIPALLQESVAISDGSSLCLDRRTNPQNDLAGPNPDTFSRRFRDRPCTARNSCPSRSAWARSRC